MVKWILRRTLVMLASWLVGLFLIFMGAIIGIVGMMSGAVVIFAIAGFVGLAGVFLLLFPHAPERWIWRGKSMMANQDILEWLRLIVRKAAAEQFREEPKDVIIRRSDMAVVKGATSKPIHNVWALVILARSSYEVLVNVGEDGSCAGFRVVG